jgi:FtsZ-binding cell division protein ZapB
MALKCIICQRDWEESEKFKCQQCKAPAHETCVSRLLLLKGKSAKSASRTWKCITCNPVDSPSSLGPPFLSEYGQIAQQRALEDSINQHTSANMKRVENSLNELLNKVQELNQRVINLEKENDELKGTCDDHQNEIEILKGRFNEMEQLNLSLNLEIHGFPQKANEDLKSIVKEVAEVIDAPESVSHIKVMYRGRKMRNNMPPPLVLKFDDESARNLWLEGRKRQEFKQLKKPMLFSESAATPSDEASGGKSAKTRFHQVRIFEQLTFVNRQLLFEAKKAASECKFAFVWSKGGKVFARREQNGPITRITSMSDIQTKIRLKANTRAAQAAGPPDTANIGN